MPSYTGYFGRAQRVGLRKIPQLSQFHTHDYYQLKQSLTELSEWALIHTSICWQIRIPKKQTRSQRYQN